MKYKLSCGVRILLLWGLCCGLSLLNPSKILAQTKVNFSLVILPAPEIKPEVIVTKNEEKVIKESNRYDLLKQSLFEKIRIDFVTDWLGGRSFPKTSFHLPSFKAERKV